MNDGMNGERRSRSERLYALLLHLYPKSFRRAYGEEMVFVFAESLRETQGGGAWLLLWMRTLLDLFMSLVHEHWRERKRDNPMQQMLSVAAGPTVALLQQPSMRKKEYLLRTGNQLVGTLRWPKHLGTTCIATSAGETWTFSQHGLFNFRIAVREAGSDRDLLTFTLNWMGTIGTIVHRDGREFHLRWTNLWGNRFALVQKQIAGAAAQGDETELLAIHIKNYFLRASADVTIHPALAKTGDAALLTLFGCYVAMMNYEMSMNGL